MSGSVDRFPTNTALGRTCNLLYTDNLGEKAWNRTCDGQTWLAALGISQGRRWRPKTKRAAWVLIQAITCFGPGSDDWTHLLNSLWELREVDQQHLVLGQGWQS